MKAPPPLTAISLALLLLLSRTPCRAEASLEEGLQRHLEMLTKEELPGMAVLLARDGKIVFQGGFGFADVENKKRTRSR